MKRTVAILIYGGAEVLDFSGPFEVFAVASEIHGQALFDVSIVATTREPVCAVNGMTVIPNRRCDELPAPDILVISGGSGSRHAMRDEALLQWVRQAAAKAEVVLSICSGARILAALGLLAHLEVTTHHQVFGELQQIEPTAILRRDARFVDTGKIVTTGGISAGIDGSFHVLARLLGPDVAASTARYMEYAWHPQERDGPN